MDIPSVRPKNSRKTKSPKSLRNLPTAVLLKKKAECDAKALKIVERMVEPAVDKDWLLKNLAWINRSHMEDVAEERSITKLCGYALCDKPLTKVVKKQYHISTIRNKVYDLSQVKNYCSYSCYKSTDYIMGQMLTSPLWLRDQEELPKYELLTEKRKTQRGKSPPGVEVDLLGIAASDDIDEEFEEKGENQNSSVEKPCEKNRRKRSSESGSNSEEEESPSIVRESGKKEKPALNAIEKTSKAEEKCMNLENLNSIVEDDTENAVGKLISIEAKDENSEKITEVPICEEETSRKPEENKKTTIISNAPTTRRKVERTKRPKNPTKGEPICLTSLTSRVEKSFKEWITEKTLRLIHGDRAERQEIIDGVRIHDKYAVLCKKLNKLQIEEEREANEKITEELKPAPHFSVLKEEAARLELKVRAYYDGKVTIDPKAEKPSSSQEEIKETETVLPFLDNHAPQTMRRRIFLDRLNKVLPDLLRTITGDGRTCAYSYDTEKSTIVKALISTFSLSSTNITFKTAEWTLVAFIIIKLLAIVDDRTKFWLSSKQATMHASMILMSYNLDPTYLDRLIVELTDVPTESKN